MSYFDQATKTIASMCEYGDYELPDDEFRRDDRAKRIASTADSLCDWVYEYLADDGLMKGWDLAGDGRDIFKQEHLPHIQRMVAIGMMMQFEHDEEMEQKFITELLKESGGKTNGQAAAKDVAP